MIAEAVHEIGLGDLTLRAVAKHLGVSVAGLYHHIDSKQDLMRLAAEHAARCAVLPKDHDQHWALWLREWAHYNRNVFIAQPELIGQYLEGGISADIIAENLDTALGLLVRQGFTIREAFDAYDVVSSCALGSAVDAIRERAVAEAGLPSLEEYERVVATRGEDLPAVRRLVDDLKAAPRAGFDDEIATVIRGIAARRGARWKPIAERLGRTADSEL